MAVVFGLSFFVVGFILCRFCRRNRAATADFEEKVAGAKEAVTLGKASASEIVGGAPPSGCYVHEYYENGKQCSGHLNLTVNQYDNKLSGSGRDSDGPMTVEEGQVNPSNGVCYWIEGQGARRVLTTGIFTPNGKLAEGKWIASNGVSANYTRFELQNIDQASVVATEVSAEEPSIVVEPDQKASTDSKVY